MEHNQKSIDIGGKCECEDCQSEEKNYTNTSRKGGSMKETFQKMVNDKEMLFEIMKFIGFTNQDFSVNSLKDMENTINEVYPEGHNPLPTTVIPFGLYLGEVMIKEMPGAHWDFEDVDNPWDMKVICPAASENEPEFIGKPLKRIIRFWKDRTDTIFGWVEMIRDIQNGKLDLVSQADKWIERENGTSVRMVKVSIDDLDNEVALKQLGKKLGRKVTKEDVLEMIKNH